MTLPTRANGGINWDKLWPPETVRPEALRLSFIQVGKEAAAHTRERCARDLETEAKACHRVAEVHRPPHAAPNEELAYLHEQVAMVLERLAAAIRKMEE